ncbi:MAG: efflux RND transporter periplasmic adaptor subunit [Bryobacterales bacterium]|nr:efflux RND transporter periplasmic adaptor subunit [Bryobacterales bacterium]
MRSAVFCLSVVCLSGCNHLERAASANRGSPEAAPVAPGRIVLPPDSRQLGRIRVAPVSLARFPVDEVQAPGKVEVNPNRISRVLMPVGGRVRQVLVKLGDAVVEGQSLLSIDSPEAGLAMAAHSRARSEERQAQAALKKAKADLERVRDLHQNRAVALKEVLNAENDLAQAQAEVEQARYTCEEAHQRLQLLGLDPHRPALEIVVRAPIGGKVLEIAVAPGEYRTDTSASLMTIADLRSVWITADVPESSIRLVRIGEQVHIELAAYPGETFHGRVMRIADSVDPVTRTIKVQAEIPNPGGRLRPEMFGRIRHSHAVESAPAIPDSALLQRQGRNVVLVEEAPGQFHEIAVQTGARQAGLTAVRDGLKAGDRVVVEGAVLLSKN